jgi:hypothetical protein
MTAARGEGQDEGRNRRALITDTLRFSIPDQQRTVARLALHPGRHDLNRLRQLQFAPNFRSHLKRSLLYHLRIPIGYVLGIAGAFVFSELAFLYHDRFFVGEWLVAEFRVHGAIHQHQIADRAVS